MIAVFLGFCLFKVFQKVDHFQQIPSQTWNVVVQILSGLCSLNHPWRALNHLNSFCGWMPEFKTKFEAYSLWMGWSRKNHKVTQCDLTVSCTTSWKSVCLHMHSKITSDWLPSYIKAAQLILNILRKAVTFQTDTVHIHIW